MKHNYTDTQLQAAIDEACNKINEEHKDVGGLLILDPEDNRWRNEKPARLNLIKSALAALPEPVDEESMLLNLLAVIHRDGGHYQAEHGTRKAVEDACKEWQRLILIAEKTGLTEPPTVDGMSLRGWFAGQALAGSDISTVMAEALEAGATSDEFSQILSMSVYKIADAMLAAREVKP
jgi:hypothetical protein